MPTPISPVRGPPAREEAPEPVTGSDLVAQPELEFDQRIARKSPSPAGGGAERSCLASVPHNPEPRSSPPFPPATGVARGRSAMSPGLDLTLRLYDGCV